VPCDVRVPRGWEVSGARDERKTAASKKKKPSIGRWKLINLLNPVSASP
jgi:hypothetical protein